MSIGDKAKARLTTCECGQPLPMHFVDLMDERSTHICSCERAYKATCGMFVLIGTQENPVMLADKIVEGTICKKCGEGLKHFWVNTFRQITGKTDEVPSYCSDCTGKALIAATSLEDRGDVR